METENKSRKSNVLAGIIAAIVIACCVAGYLLYSGLQRHLAQKTDEQTLVEDVAISDENLLGTYEIRMESGSDVARFTGFIDVDAMGEYNLHILSEYEPRVLTLTLGADGKLENPEIGVGVMTYKKSIDKTVITFTKDNVKCVLLK